jgi:hypothetical protein
MEKARKEQRNEQNQREGRETPTKLWGYMKEGKADTLAPRYYLKQNKKRRINGRRTWYI